MSDSDDDITHVFDQTNGVLDGFEGESDGTSEGAAERRGEASSTAPAAGSEQDEPSARGRTEEDAVRGEERAYAVDSRGTATDTEDAQGTAASGGAHVATAADGRAGFDGAQTAADGRVGGPGQDTEPSVVQRSEATDPPVDHGHGGSDGTAAGTAGIGALAGDDSIAHVFDQTNGVVEGVEGESGGTAEGDEASSADRHGSNEPNPVGQQDAWHDDHYGADDGRDPNP